MTTTNQDQAEQELRDTLELFRKQCTGDGQGIGFEEAVHRIEEARTATIKALADKVISSHDSKGYMMDERHFTRDWLLAQLPPHNPTQTNPEAKE